MKRKLQAFTLTELLVVLVIIGILVLIALPNLTNQVTKAKAVEAKTQLKYVYDLQVAYFHENSKYTNDLNELGYDQVKLKTEGGSANYLITISSANTNSFQAEAVAVVDFDQDGTLNKWSINQEKNLKEEVRD